MQRALLSTAFALVALGAAVPAAGAVTYETLTTELQSPTAIAFRPGVANPVVTEQKGRIVTVRKGKVVVLADLADRVGQAGGEQGLLGLAFHPRYAENRFLYVNYTDPAGNTQIVRFTTGRFHKPLKGSAKTLLSVRQPYANHNGGSLAFGPDGFLYIGLGDGGSGGDPGNRAQNPSTPLGKILRIDVDGGDPYAIPPTNPFAGGGGDPTVWALGLRNPWRFSFDRRGGGLWVGDVGQRQREEVSWVPRAAPPLPNFGWNAFEGDKAYAPQPTRGDLIKPIATYDHGQGCSVVGGYVYRGRAIRSLRGRYVFGDWCKGAIWAITRKDTTRTPIGVTLAKLTTFGEDDQGELYAASGTGRLIKIVP